MCQEGAIHSRRFAPLFVLLAICASSAGAPDEGSSRDDLLSEFSKLIPPGTITESHAMNSNGFRLEYDRYKQLGEGCKPNGDEFQSVILSASGAFKTQVVKGVHPAVDNGVSIYDRDSGTPLVVLSDSNGDGQPDSLTYSNVDVNGGIWYAMRKGIIMHELSIISLCGPPAAERSR
jgi:hypothetical protein